MSPKYLSPLRAVSQLGCPAVTMATNSVKENALQPSPQSATTVPFSMEAIVSGQTYPSVKMVSNIEVLYAN